MGNGLLIHSYVWLVSNSSSNGNVSALSATVGVQCLYNNGNSIINSHVNKDLPTVAGGVVRVLC